MSNNLIQYAFAAGEVSKRFFSRGDLEKYDMGVALSHNFFTDYNGGLSTRPGLIFLDYIKEDDKPVKLAKFFYAPNVANTYTILFGHEYIRFLQDGGYVLEADKVISGVTWANPAVVTCNSHGFSDGDWVKISDVTGMVELNGRTFVVANSTTNTFQLQHPTGGNVNSTSYTSYSSGGAAARVYTLASPYDADDLAELRAHQQPKEDVLNLTHIDYAPRTLVRNDHADWTLALVTFENKVDRPNSLSLSASNPGDGGYAAAVTSVDQEGRESLPRYGLLSSGMLSDDTTNSFYKKGYIAWSWGAATDAVYYNLYRSIFTPQAATSGGETLGFLAKVAGRTYRDTNSQPDFARGVPNSFDPFADNSILFIEILNGGMGYPPGANVTLTDSTGSGFVGIAVANSSGSLQAITILERGRDYSNPSISTGWWGGGTGATFTIYKTPADGNWPALSAVFQQRQLYAATRNQPVTVWGSRVGDFTNFGISTPVLTSDGYEFVLDTEDVSPIRHLIPTRGGILTFTQTGIWLLHGGTDGQAISSLNALADPQSYNGCSKLPPLRIDTDILYIEGKGTIARLLSYNDFSKVYGGVNVSILAHHLLPQGVPIVDWTYAESPYQMVWAIRSDGALLPFTIVKEQNVYAWGQCWTRGLFKNIISVQEETRDAVYCVVERYVNGRWTKFLEQMSDRRGDNVEDAFCVDSGLSLGHTYPAANLSMAAATGENIVFTASASVFSSGDVGKVIRAGGGMATITGYTNGTTVTATFSRDVTAVLPEVTPAVALPVDSGDWSMDTPVTTISGLWHLEGEEVVALADGNVVTGLTVTDGEITLPVAATVAHIGLPYTCRVRTLPPIARDTIIEHKVKNILGVGVRLHESRGLKVGSSLDDLYPIKERAAEDWGDPTAFNFDLNNIMIASGWDIDSQTYFVQDNPLPTTITGFIIDAEVGDDNN